MSQREPFDSEDEKDLIDAEFESMVADLSLDQSAPTTYLDELDSIASKAEFSPPHIPKKSLQQQWREIVEGVKRWKNNRDNYPDEGAAL